MPRSSSAHQHCSPSSSRLRGNSVSWVSYASLSRFLGIDNGEKMRWFTDARQRYKLTVIVVLLHSLPLLSKLRHFGLQVNNIGLLTFDKTNYIIVVFPINFSRFRVLLHPGSQWFSRRRGDSSRLRWWKMWKLPRLRGGGGGGRRRRQRWRWWWRRR